MLLIQVEMAAPDKIDETVRGVMVTRRRPAQVAAYDVDLFQQFVSDPDLGLAIEALKRANDIFDIIEPQETQHSQMLQWLLNPREGHGQGDALFKDFLTAAWTNCYAEDGPNTDFFSHWAPARINMTGFHSILLLREYRITNGNHLDFFIVDPVNRFVIVVENKYKAQHGNEQLKRYRRSVQQLVASHPGFKNFHVALIALDRGRSRQLKLSEMKKYWVYLDYTWLEAGASRAESQMRRGNQTANLLISYCQRQSDYESQAEKDVDTILARLTRHYRSLLTPLAEARMTKLSKTQGVTPGDPSSDIWLFTQHYPELVARLTHLKNLAFLRSDLAEELPSVKFEYEEGDAWIQIFDKAWYPYTHADENDVRWWPFFIRVRYIPPELMMDDEKELSADENLYRVMVVYWESYLKPDTAERARVAIREKFPELSGGRQNAHVRRVEKDAVKESNLVSEVLRRYRMLCSALQGV
ncbi:PD-(D/E)XK nuclease family protein [Burkholderia cepacia]|uniref:PDDEXK-like family protein n=1 Tax=Burkholderia cepacia TaxID=292 RepID=UPI001E399180|nr:PD-(D/E)XK nuclease family protein [Burkholderia cepacia]